MITLTTRAVQFFKRSLAGQTGVCGIKLGVKPAGCSGLSYTLAFAREHEITPEDKIFEEAGIKVVVDPKSFPYLAGTEIDCVKEGLNEIPKFNNPNVKGACGCGESFTVEGNLPK